MTSGARARAALDPTRPKGWKIASRMRVIVAAPLVAVVGFAGLALTASARQAGQAGDLGRRAALAVAAGELAYELQRERAAAAELLTSGGVTAQDAYVRQTGETDAALVGYLRQRGIVGSTGAAAVLDRLDDVLDDLPALRAQVRTASTAAVSATTFSYRIMIADLLTYRESTAQGVPSAQTADAIRAAAALSRTAEAVGQQQVAVMRAAAAGQLTPAMQQDITAARTSFTEASLVFLRLADPSWRVWWEQAGSGGEAVALQRLEDQVSRARPGSRLGLATADWIAATQARAARLFQVQRRVDAAVLATVQADRGGQQRRAIAEGIAMVVALVLTAIVTWAVARQITRRLRRLRDAANEVAFEKLPAMVSALRDADRTALTPEALAERSTSMLERTSGDEIGEVGQAFDAVHRAAVRTAAEQAVMRANTADIFIHLSRREQRLVDAVLAQVDRVERDETDPDRLNGLYTLDHLATRMARINASLLVLGGVGVGRVRHDDVPFGKVLQAALSQIEHYTRVRLGVVDADVAVAAEAVDEVVHLLAELMDNATTYSAPDTEAWATARALGDRVIVQIGDEGVGLPSARLAQLNELLRRPPAIDVAAVRAMGLTVVGQLATRLGAAVELRPGPRLGTIAEVTLPSALIRPLHADLPIAPAARSAELNGAGQGERNGAGRGERSEPRPDVERLPAPRRSIDPWPPAQGTGADRTQELPIFQQVNNWFRADDGGAGGDWASPADDGWRTAAELATPEPAGTTASGLPLRTPQRHLVPGAVDAPDRRGRPQRRDPAQVSAAMSAYARGVAGRPPQLVKAAASSSAASSSGASTQANGEHPE